LVFGFMLPDPRPPRGACGPLSKVRASPSMSGSKIMARAAGVVAMGG
jgi:hypothetical protein